MRARLHNYGSFKKDLDRMLSPINENYYTGLNIKFVPSRTIILVLKSKYHNHRLAYVEDYLIHRSLRQTKYTKQSSKSL